jgi:hypothetical protein
VEQPERTRRATNSKTAITNTTCANTFITVTSSYNALRRMPGFS